MLMVERDRRRLTRRKMRDLPLMISEYEAKIKVGIVRARDCTYHSSLRGCNDLQLLYG